MTGRWIVVGNLRHYLNRMTVTDRGEQIAIFTVGVIVGIGLCICLLLIP
jgi:hypothetical protein